MNSFTLLQKIDYLFKRDGIPWENLISDLSDNTNYMRGKKSGLETKLREKAPNMLEIGGDTCREIHSAVKRFCDPFLGFVEKVLDDLNADTKFSSDIILARNLFFVEPSLLNSTATHFTSLALCL